MSTMSTMSTTTTATTMTSLTTLTTTTTTTTTTTSLTTKTTTTTTTTTTVTDSRLDAVGEVADQILDQALAVAHASAEYRGVQARAGAVDMRQRELQARAQDARELAEDALADRMAQNESLQHAGEGVAEQCNASAVVVPEAERRAARTQDAAAALRRLLDELPDRRHRRNATAADEAQAAARLQEVNASKAAARQRAGDYADALQREMRWLNHLNAQLRHAEGLDSNHTGALLPRRRGPVQLHAPAKAEPNVTAATPNLTGQVRGQALVVANATRQLKAAEGELQSLVAAVTAAKDAHRDAARRAAEALEAFEQQQKALTDASWALLTARSEENEAILAAERQARSCRQAAEHELMLLRASEGLRETAAHSEDIRRGAEAELAGIEPEAQAVRAAAEGASAWLSNETAKLEGLRRRLAKLRAAGEAAGPGGRINPAQWGARIRSAAVPGARLRRPCTWASLLLALLALRPQALA